MNEPPTALVGLPALDVRDFAFLFNSLPGRPRYTSRCLFDLPNVNRIMSELERQLIVAFNRPLE